MKNFCIAPCLFSTTKLLRDSNKNLEHLYGGWKTYHACFVFTPRVGIEHFWVDLDGKHVFAPTPRVGVVHICGVYVILILRAWQTSHKDQQSLTKLNAKQVAYVSESFPSLKISMFGSGRNSSFCHTGTHHVVFLCFPKEIFRI